MLAHIKAFLLDRQGRAEAEDGRHTSDELHLAAAALLIEAARLDGEFDKAERTRIEGLLADRFSLSEEEVASVVETADAVAEDSVALYGFTSKLRQNFDHDERIRLIEMLWEVVYADGDLHPFEANLLRRVAGLLYVTDQESGAARRRVLERAGGTDERQHP